MMMMMMIQQLGLRLSIGKKKIKGGSRYLCGGASLLIFILHIKE